ncbi:MAG: PAS domain S-box protein [Candidatus Micrarchaeota archaeon]
MHWKIKSSKASGGIDSGSLEARVGLNLESIVEKLFEITYIRDLEGVITFISPQVSRYGYQPKELVGHNVREFIHSSDVRLIRGKDASEQSNRFRIRKKDGEYIHFEVATIPLLKNGRAEGYVGFIRDVTAREKAEEALRKSEETFHSLFERAPLPYQSLDIDGNIIEVNGAWLLALGYKKMEVIGRNFSEFLAPGYIDIFKVQFARFKEAGKACGTEYELSKKDGSRITVSFSGQLSYDENGQFKQTHCIFQDITERKMIEKALKEERDMMQNYLDVAEVMFLALDKDGNVSLINKKGCSILGYTQNEIIGKNWFENFLPKQNRLAVKAAFRGLMANNIAGVEYFENNIATKGGSKRLIAWHNAILRDKNGDITGTLSSGLDITERKRAEEALLESQELLRSTLASMDDLILTVDNNRTIIGFHKPQNREIVLDLKSFVGKNYEAVLPTDLAVRLKTAIAGASATGSVQHFNHALLVGDRMGWFSVKVSSMLDLSGKPVGFTIVSRDITDSKKIEEKISGSERKYRQLVESLNEGIWAIDEKAYTTFVNPQMAEMLGYTVGEMVGEHLFSFMEERSMQKSKKFLQRRKKGIAEHYDFEFIKKDGTRLFARLGARPVLDNNGNYEGSLVAVTDITESKKTEEVLRQSEELLRSAVCSTHDLVLVIDKGGIITGCHNPSGRKPPISQKNFIGSHFQKFFAPYKKYSRPNARNYLLSAIKRIKAGGGTEQIKYVVKQGGRSLNFNTTISSCKDSHGGFDGIIVVIKDGLRILR